MTTRRSTTSGPASDQRSGADLEAGLGIDRDDLDGCLVDQPDSYYHVALAHSDAVAERDAAKLDLEHLQANLDVSIRADADAKGEKMTEAKIQREIQLDAGYNDAKKRVLLLQGKVDRLQALKDAFRERRHALSDLVSLAMAERTDRAGAAGAYEARARQAQQAEDMRRDHMRRRRVQLEGSDE